MCFCQFGKIRTVDNLLFEVLALFFGADEDVSCCCLGHLNLLWVVEKSYPADLGAKSKDSEYRVFLSQYPPVKRFAFSESPSES